MTHFVVTYDLAGKPPADYELLEAFLEKNFESAHVQKSVWVVWAPDSVSADDLIAMIGPYVEDDDSLFVIPVAGPPRWHRLLKGADEWLRRHFP